MSGVRPGPGPISDLLVDDHTDSIAIEPRLEGAARVRGAFSVLLSLIHISEPTRRS